MKEHNHYIINLVEIQRLKEALINNENMCFSLIFGSYAKGNPSINSDIDLGVYYYKPPEGLEILDFINTLSDYAQKKVDLTILNKASAFLRHQVMLNCIRLFIHDPVMYRKFREQTITDFLIYKYISNIYYFDKEL